MNHIPPPPVSRWERYTQSAARYGISPRAFLALLESDPMARVQRFGKRSLLHVAAEDADRIGQRLQQGATR